MGETLKSDFQGGESESLLLGENRLDATVGLDGREIPREGYLFAVNKDAEVRIPADCGWGFLEETLAGFIDTNYPELREEGRYVGVWEDDSSICIDVVAVTNSKDEALARAKENGQKAIFDLNERKNIHIDSSQE